jgi:hypothetical protein
LHESGSFDGSIIPAEARLNSYLFQRTEFTFNNPVFLNDKVVGFAASRCQQLDQ